MKPKIAFITGGYSGEAEISYQSAKTIEKNIDTEKFDYYKIDITPEGWFHVLANCEKIQVAAPNSSEGEFTLLIPILDPPLFGFTNTGNCKFFTNSSGL